MNKASAVPTLKLYDLAVNNRVFFQKEIGMRQVLPPYGKNISATMIFLIKNCIDLLGMYFARQIL